MIGILLLAGSAFTACSSSDDEINRIGNDERKVTLVVRATKGTDRALTRALADEGTQIKGYWEEGEQVAAYKKVNTTYTYLGMLTATPDANDNTKATLSGEFEPDPTNAAGFSLAAGDILELRFVESLSTNSNKQIVSITNNVYRKQDGTLSSIAKFYDYATAEVTTNAPVPDDANNITLITTSDASFSNQRAIVKFSLKDGNNGGIPINATSLKVHDGEGIVYNVCLNEAKSEFYTILPAIDNKKVTLIAYDGTKFYKKSVEGVTLLASKFYEISVSFTETPSAPAGVEAVDLGIVVNGKKVLFADRILGATDVTGTLTTHGYYIAWGEVLGYNDNGGESFKTYADYDLYRNTWYNGVSYQKYNTADNITTLAPEDDAATVHWGKPWHTPTKDQLQALVNTYNDNTNYRWTFYSGVENEGNGKYQGSENPGWLIEKLDSDGDPTDAKLFLRYSGFLRSTNTFGQYNEKWIDPRTKSGYYWTSTIGVYTGAGLRPYYFYVYNSGPSLRNANQFVNGAWFYLYINRNDGASILPVKEVDP